MVEKKHKKRVIPLLKKCIESKDDIFYNINEADDELSIVVDTKLEDIYANISCVCYPDTYNVIQIYENCSGIDHVGIVSQISSLFTDIGISILYFNTYKYNFVLVKDKDTDRAVKALNLIRD